MARTMGRLKAAWVERIKVRLEAGKSQEPKDIDMHCDGHGLYLQVSERGASWIFRYTRNGRKPEMGLGSLSLFGIEEARAMALDARKLLHAGIDPLEHRNAVRAQAKLGEMKTLTFGEAATKYATAHQSEWSSQKHARQWMQSISVHAIPVLGPLPVQAINTPEVLRALQPIWDTIPETASRVRGRIESILDFARASGYRTGENPARWRGHLDHILSARGKARRVRHHPALPYDQVPEFMAKLRSVPGPGALALQFLIYTAARPGTVVDARWGEIDLQNKVWIIPPDRMKARREHRVPLSSAAMALLVSMNHNGDRVFSTSQTTVLEILRALRPGIVPHGFRSTFRDWAAERTNFPREVAEMALAHAIPDAVEAAYRRGDLFEKRARMMEAWSQFCTSSPVERGRVVALGRG